MDMFILEKSLWLRKFFSFCLILLVSSACFALGKIQRIQTLIENGSEKEMTEAFKKYNYLNRTTLGSDGDSLIMEAIEKNRGVGFIKLLVKADVSLRKKNRNGQTALHYVCRHQADDEVFSYVLEKWGRKASVGRALLKKDRTGTTAYEYALMGRDDKRIAEVESFLDPLKSVSIRGEFEMKERTVLDSGFAAEKTVVLENAYVSEKTAVLENADVSEKNTVLEKNAPSEKSELKNSSEEKKSMDGKTKGLSSTREIPSEDGKPNVSLEGVKNGDVNEEPKVFEDLDSAKMGGKNGSSGVRPYVSEKSSLPAAENTEADGSARTSVDIEGRQRELSRLYDGKALSSGERTFLFDYEPRQEVQEPVEKKSAEIPLASIKNPNTRDFNGRSLLMKAVKDGNDWEIRSLISSGADVNLADNDGWSALMYAVRYQNNLEIVRLLVENGARVDARNRYGSSALQIAATHSGNPEVLRFILQNFRGSQNEVFKAFVFSITSNSGNYASQMAKVQVFIDRGLPVNRFYEGKTPLMYACEYASSTALVKLLFENGADVSVRDASGKRAFDYAKANARLERDDVYWALNGK